MLADDLSNLQQRRWLLVTGASVLLPQVAAGDNQVPAIPRNPTPTWSRWRRRTLFLSSCLPQTILKAYWLGTQVTAPPWARFVGCSTQPKLAPWSSLKSDASRRTSFSYWVFPGGTAESMPSALVSRSGCIKKMTKLLDITKAQRSSSLMRANETYREPSR